MPNNSDQFPLLTKSIETRLKPPIVVVGTVSLDILHFWDGSHTVSTDVQVEMGGVCKHVACVLGELGETPRFISANFGGELGHALATVLNANHVDWQPLAESAPFSLFEAHIDSADHVFRESFVEGEALLLLTPEAIRRQPAITDANILVGCTNLSVAAMYEMAALARANDAQFWLLTSSSDEVPRCRQLLEQLRPLNGESPAAVNLLSLNLEELQLLVGRPLNTMSDIAAAAASITEAVSHCLVTLGSRGALLAVHGLEYVHYQPVAPISGRSPVGGGDVLFASLLAGKIQGKSWAEALTFATLCTRRYLLRDKNSPTPYAGLRASEADRSTPVPCPPIEKVFLTHDR